LAGIRNDEDQLEEIIMGILESGLITLMNINFNYRV